MARAFNLADIFEVVVDAVPDRLALVAGEVRHTYRSLDERANRLGHHLATSGVQPGQHVGIYAWNRAEWVEAMLGIYKIRAVPINVNFRYVEAELRYLFDNADLVGLVYERGFGERVANVLADAPRLTHLVTLDDATAEETAVPGAADYEAALAAASPARGFAPRSGDDLYILYTGGTTGMPKGVMWRSEDIFFGALQGGNAGGAPVATVEALARHADHDASVSVVTAPMMHGGAQWATLIGLSNANTVVLYTGHHFDGDEIWRIVEREQASALMMVGDAMGRPLADALAAAPGVIDTSKLQVLSSGGSLLSKAVKEELRRQLPAVRVIDAFGASETGANGAVLDFDGPAAGPRFNMGDHTTVVDDDLRPLVPGSGQIGRLARRGHIPLGYYKDEAKTATTFVHDADGVRWVLPGDMAMVEADGAITILGRGSVCIQTGGEKVFPEEVEAALKSHPDVFDAVVVGVPDERFVERVAAIVRPRLGRSPDLDTLADHCRTQVAGYKVPRQLQLVDDIQRTPAGKPDYRWAKAHATRSAEGSG